MTKRERITGTSAIWVLSGVLGIAACGAAQPGNPGEELEQTTAALTSAKPLARGVVRDGTGAPIARARVDVRAAGGHRILACAATAADGSFALDVRAGTYDITVTPKTGFAPQAFPAQVIARGTELELVIARIPATVNLTGQVTDQSGHPLSVGVCGTTCVGTDASGAFAVTARSDQPLRIDGALSPAGSFGANFAFDPTQSAPLAIVIPIVNFTGTVLDPGGAPMPGASVTSPPCSEISFDGLSGTFCLDGTQTDSNGRFQFTSLPGDVALQVFGALGAYVTESVSSGDTDVTIQVPPLQALSGRITDRDGNGLPGSRLCLTHDGCQSRFCFQACAFSDSSGSYEIDVSAGTYAAQLFSAPGSSPIGFYTLSGTITVSRPTDVDVTFPDRVITGTVLNVDGTPAANVQVSDRCRSANIAGFVGSVCAFAQTSDQDGRFRLIRPAPGDTELTAQGATTTSVPFTVTSDADVVIQLQAAQPTTGQVLAGDGSPVPGVTVCYDAPELARDSCTTTDASGQYRTSLTPGTYSLSAGGSASGVSFFDLIIDSTTVPAAPATIRLAATRATPLRIVNTDGSPRAGVSLAANCFDAPASGTTEDICGQSLVSDAAGAATLVSGVGVPLGLQISSGPDFESPVVMVDDIPVGASTELTIAIQSPPAP